MRVRVDQDKCTGCGLCPMICPDVFEMVGDKAKEKVSDTDKKCAEDAEASCPVDAIIISK